MKKHFLTTSVFVLIIAATAFLASCATGIKGSGNIIQKDTKIEKFSQLVLNSSIDVIYTQSNELSAKIEADDNLMEHIIVKNDGKQLVVEFDKSIQMIRNTHAKVYISAPEFSELQINGSSDFTSKSVQFNNPFAMHVAGSGYIEIKDMKVNDVKMSLMGSGRVEIGGTCSNANIQVSGSGDIKLYNMELKHSVVDIAGSGDVSLGKTEKITAKIAGSGDIHYIGNPEISKSIIGSGDLIKDF